MKDKAQLQKEILEKVKPGTKPSDIKKQRAKNSQNPSKILKSPSPIVQSDEGYESDKSDIPVAPPLPNSQIKELQTQVNFWSTTANNHLKSLQLAQAKISGLETDLSVVKSFNKGLQEQIQNLKTLKTPPKESELLKEKNHQIEIIAIENEKNLKKVKDMTEEMRQLEQTITTLKTQAKAQVNNPEEVKETKTFPCSNCQQTKPQSELSRVFGSFSFCLECSKKARATATQQKQEPQIEEFICHLCSQGKKEVPNRMKLDETLQEYLVCSQCRPFAKEFNEADLITEELWNKYPYSSASEILEKEFGIKKNN